MSEDFDQRLKRNIGTIKGAIKDLGSMKLRVEIDRDVETILGSLVDNVYIVDRLGGKVILQKHLFTVTPRRTKE